MKHILHILALVVIFAATAFTQNYSIQFNGADAKATISRQIQDDFTIEFWVKTTQTAGTGSQWYNGKGIVDAEVGGAANDFGVSLVGSKIAFGVGNSDNTIFSTSNINDGKWHHVAVTRVKSSGNRNLYIDGFLEASGTGGNTGSLTAPSTISIGWLQASSNYFNGQIDEVRLWNVARTQSEIQSTLYSALQGDESGLVNYYNFNDGIGTTAEDIAGSNNATLTASVVWAEGFAPPSIYVSLLNYGTLNKLADTITVEVTSATGWTVSDTSSWLTTDPSSGSGNGSVQIYIAENTSGSTRNGTVTFMTDSDTMILTITQNSVSITGNGTNESPYMIYGYDDLKAIASFGLNAVYRLANNIDASTSASENSGAGFVPIGNFTGKFHGGGYIISNLTINRSGQDNIGLFGYTNGITVDSVGLVNVNISGRSVVGGLAGYVSFGTITNSYATGTVSNNYFIGEVGGLVGAVSDGTVTNCHFSGVVNSDGGSFNVGGLVGRISDGTITNSYATGIVNSTSSAVGGLVGNFYSSFFTPNTINNSYAACAVNGNFYVGGLLGNANGGTITNSYAIGTVSGSNSGVGGLVGSAEFGMTITNSYAAGAVSGAENVGGLIGNVSGGTITSSYWDKETSGQETSAGGQGKPTLHLKVQSTFVGWNFEDVWEIVEWESYPTLRAFPDDPLPVELVSFTASAKQNSIELLWNTTTEVNNFGFEIQRSVVRDQMSEDRTTNSQRQTVNNWSKVGFVEGNGTTNSPKNYSFTDKNISSGKVAYRLKQIDRDGKFKYSPEVEVEVGSVPKVFALEQNYPNPFNPSTIITYQLPTNSFVTLKVYDVLGKEVAELVNEAKEAGSYSVQLSANSSQMASGVYFYSLKARQTEGGRSGNFVETKRLLLLR